MKILFLLKTNATSGGNSTSKSGLLHSARFIAERINEFPHATAHVIQVKDQNAIFEVVATHAPDTVIIEAVFVTPDKLQWLVDKFPHTRFIIRVHSRIPFIAMEGNVIDWIKQYGHIAEVSFNNKQTATDMQRVGIDNIYLPNIYPHVEHHNCEPVGRKHHYKIGCLGSIRPFKNQLSQAVGAILFANKRNATLHFYVNSTGIEQQGESVLKNLRALFGGTRHKLVEIDWLEHDAFIDLIKKMDACMQVSLTETFNLVTADAVLAHVPVVVSEQIDWLSCRKADPNNESNIAEVLEHVIDHSRQQVEDNIHDLDVYNSQAILRWFRLLHRD